MHHPENLWALGMNCSPLATLLSRELPLSLVGALVTGQLPLPQARGRLELLFCRLAMEVP